MTFLWEVFKIAYFHGDFQGQGFFDGALTNRTHVRHEQLTFDAIIADH